MIRSTPFVLLAGSAVLAGCCGKQPPAASPPNILIAIADDVSFPHMGAYGCPWVSTPAFDRVASHGILFSNCYTPNAKSAPSRACLLTGLNSWQLEEAGNHIGFWPENKFPTFFEMLAAGGYYAAFTGKGWAPGNPGLTDGQPRRLTGIPYQAHTLTPPTACISPVDYAANFAEFLREKPKGKPWVFWYGGNEPHRAYEYGTGISLGGRTTADVDRVPGFWPDSDTVRTDMLDYAYEIEHFDTHLGRILAALERAGELDNTIVVVTADNGMPFPRCKGLQYEYSNHLPMAVMWPRGIKNPGRACPQYVSLIDLAPTFLRLAGVDAADHGAFTQGREMTDLFDDAPRHDRSYILLGQERHDYGRPQNQGYPIRSILRDGYLYLCNFKPALWPAGNPETGYLNTDGSPTKTNILTLFRSRTDVRPWELAFGRHPAEELYKVDEDPDCLRNLACDPDYAARKATMREQLMADLGEQKDPRVTGDGDVFDRYPFFQQSSFFFWERYTEGHITQWQTDWVEPGDFETTDTGDYGKAN